MQLFHTPIQELQQALDSELRAKIAELSARGLPSNEEAALIEIAGDLIRQRKHGVTFQEQLPGILGIPVVRRAMPPGITKVTPPGILGKTGPANPTVSRGTYYQLTEEVYNDILKVIRNIGASMVQTPETFHPMHESDLRNVLLAGLNGIYKHSAAGARFHGKGKTDICIEMLDRPAFVAECKVWDQDLPVMEDIDQLLNYHAWDDCKTAYIVFHKSHTTTALYRKLKAMLVAHQDFISFMSTTKHELRCRLRSKRDPAITIQLHAFLFDISSSA